MGEMREVQTRFNILATGYLSKNTLSRKTRGHTDLLRKIFPKDTIRLDAFTLNNQLKGEFSSSEKVKYHRESFVDNKLVSKVGDRYYLTPYGVSVLCSTELRKLVRGKGFIEVDLRLLFELLDAEGEGRVNGVPIRELSSKLEVDRTILYAARTRLGSQERPYIESRQVPFSTDKDSERRYALTNEGIAILNNTICHFLANVIIDEYKLPRWVPISEIFGNRMNYPLKIQRFIEKSYVTVSQRRLPKAELSDIEFFVYPWLEPMVIEYVISKLLGSTIKYLKDVRGFSIKPVHILTGTDALESFSKAKGTKATLFALESLHLPEAKYLIENSVLVGGLAGTTAYSIMGRGKNYKKAAYVSDTVYSKRLVESVADFHHVRKSAMLSIEGEADYLKVINKELEDKYIFHLKSPFVALMKTQFSGLRELLREPIIVGLFVSDEQTDLESGLELKELVRLSLESIQNPRIYYEAVESYVRKLPSLNAAFSNVPIVEKIELSSRKKAQFTDWSEIFNGYNEKLQA